MNPVKQLIPIPVKRFIKGIISTIAGPPHEAPVRERFHVGRRTYGEPEVLDWKDGTTLRIGSFCSIAAGVNILLGGNHRTDWITTYPFLVMSKGVEGARESYVVKGDVLIGNDVWIGQFATILSGVTIGNGAVIGVSAVVTKNVPAYAIVAGNPAKIIRMRFSENEIAQLEQIAWWDWPDGKIEAAMPFLLSGNIAGLAEFASRR